MPTSTYTPIATTTITTATASYNFSSIPQTYSDLVLVAAVRSDTAASTTGLLLQVNGQTGNYYDGYYLRTDGSTITAARYNKFINPSYAAPVGTMLAASATASTYSIHTINWMGYSQTNTNKTFIARSNSTYVTNGITELVTNQYFSTLVISSILLFPEAGNFAAGSTLTLYGIKAA
jgi:hypothetical protein